MSRPSHPVPIPFRSQVLGVAWPPVLTGAAASMAMMLGQLDRSQWLDAATIRSHQFGQLLALTRHAAAHSPQFARRLREAGLTPDDLAFPEGLARLPLLRRQHVQSAPDLFCTSIPPDHAPVREARTSGSTGEPVCVRRTSLTQFMWSAHAIRDLLWHPRDLQARQCAIRANVNKIQRHSNWGGLLAEMFDTGEVLVIPITTPLDELMAMLADYRPDNMVAYPNVVAAMIQQCRARGHRIEGLRHLRMIGETLSPTLRRAVTEVLGADVTDAYSSEEIGYITLQCPDSDLYHVMAETVIVEVLRDDGTPCGDGELGRVVVTDLHNFATPMIRYEMGDYAEVGPACPCGRGLPTLRRIVGRERNLLRLADGGRHWPLLGGLHFRDVAPVRQFQAIQHDLQRIEIRLVLDRPMTEAEERDLRAMILRALGHPFTLELRFFEGRLPTGANGKFEEFVCAMGTV